MAKNKKIKFLLLTLLILAAVFVFFEPVFAQVNVGLEQIGQETGLSTTDIRVTIARVIRIIIGFLGIVALVLILYGGFVWMTAGGNEDKISQAKRILLNAGIGLAVVLASFAISTFIIRSLGEATGLQEGEPGTSGPVTPPVLPPDSFVLKSISPSGDIAIRNTRVRALFNKNVNPATAEDNFTVTVSETGEEVEGSINTEGRVIEFEPSAACPEPNEDRKCFAADTEFRVEILGGLRSTDNKQITCGGLAAGCSDFFTTGDLIDTSSPQIEITYPDFGESVSVNDQFPLEALATDDAGISFVEFFVDGEFVDSSGPLGQSPVEFVAQGIWDTEGLDLLSRHTITATAHDIDNNSATSSGVDVIIRAEHCFNGVQDEGEEALDCGGDSASEDYCGACDGSACSVSGDADICSPDDSLCASGFCNNNDCICQSPPKILEVNPGNGAPGNYISIKGENFGNARGSIIFLGIDADGDGFARDAGEESDDVEASLADCGGAWKDDVAVVEIPEEAIAGPIMLINGRGLLDRTNDSFGPYISDFIINEISRPGLCEIIPDQGSPGVEFSLLGKNFGGEQGDSELHFSNLILQDISEWSQERISSIIPEVDEDEHEVYITVGGQSSNSLNFNIRIGENVNPRIDYIDPESGSFGQYITLVGDRFGSPGAVYFVREGDQTDVIPADIDFPEQCSERYWKNNYITVKVPSGIDLGEYQMEITTSRGRRSNQVSFSVNESELSPGICAINPDNGPVGTEVRIYGDGFGERNEGSSVRFWQNANADSASIFWSEQFIKAFVPQDASTGPLQVVNEGILSNRIPFEIRSCSADNDCREGENCCSDGTCREVCPVDPDEAVYAWLFSTGEIPVTPQIVEECNDESIPSPTPWGRFREGGEVCLNASIGARFNTLMNTASIFNNVILEKCIASADGEEAAHPCSQTQEVDTGDIIIQDFTDSEGDLDSHGFQLTPLSLLDEDALYRVSLTTNIQSANTTSGNPGSFMSPISAQAAEACGFGEGEYANISYCWTFGTTDNLCEIGRVQVEPIKFLMTELDQEQKYSATPIARQNACWILSGASFDWQWESSDESRAIISNDDGDNDGRIDELQTASALGETGPNFPVLISASTERRDGEGRLFIDFTDPKIINRIPDCNSACPGALIEAEFNVAMQKASIEGVGDMSLWLCEDESCRTFEGDVVLEKAEYIEKKNSEGKVIGGYAVLRPQNLIPNRYYRVIIKAGQNGVKSKSGRELSDLNYGLNYSWKFRTTDNPDLCVVDRVEVIPRRSVLTYIGQVQEFRAEAYGTPDDCAPEGQKLSLRYFDETQNKFLDLYDWNWNSGKVDVATLTPERDPWSGDYLDANPGYSRYCTSSCLNTGTNFEVSVCGNGVVEPGEDCDKGDIIPDDGCSSRCLNEGSTGGAVCGNGEIENGEDCDDGNAVSGDGCSSECLNEGVQNSGPICGNLSVEYGEDCDDGALIDGDGCSSECLNEGSDTSYGSECGNGVKEYGEDCDDGNIENGDGCSSKCLNEGSSDITCGFYSDETACSGIDYCDWAGLTEECLYNDFCSQFLGADCLEVEVCVLQPSNEGSSSCRKSLCGDNILDLGEECDDGNLEEGDGCGSDCLFEGTLSGSGAECGNGVIGSGEDCDDGNAVSGDGCSSECLNEGTPNNLSVCKSGLRSDPQPGEDCDFGSGDNNIHAGCSDQCLNLGSSAIACELIKNRNDCPEYCSWDAAQNQCVYIDDFCEKYTIPGDYLGCFANSFCRWEADECSKSICGDGEVDIGEDCDDGNIKSGDGCAENCTKEGSDLFAGSVCGDGNIDRNAGEECEASSSGGDGNIDPFQGAVAVNEGSSVITASAEGASCGNDCGEVSVVCACNNDSSCSELTALGENEIACGRNDCCYLRPEIGQVIPESGNENVCRNTAVQIIFNELMEPATLSENIELWRNNGSDPCGTPEEVSNNLFSRLRKFAKGWFVKTGLAAPNEYWCPVPGSIENYTTAFEGREVTAVRFVPFAVLKPDSTYKIIVKGDRTGEEYGGIEGVVSLVGQVGLRDGVSLINGEDGILTNGINKDGEPGDSFRLEIFGFQSDFKTKSAADENSGICVVESVRVSDSTGENFHVFRRAEVVEKFTAAAISSDGQLLQPIENLYAWSWKWNSQNEDLASIPSEERFCRDSGDSCVQDDDCEGSYCTSAISQDIASQNQNGETNITATAKIETDFISEISELGRETTGSAAISNILCVNLWNEINQDTYLWDFDAPGTEYKNRTNIALWYCWDFGQEQILPDLTAVRIYNSPDAFREALLVDEDTGEAIGFKVLFNQEHLSLGDWYQKMEFEGQPQFRESVYGYPAIVDGNTTYIMFGNDVCSGKRRNCLYTNVLAVSYSEGSGEQMQNIYNQILENIKFNTNIQDSEHKEMLRRDVRRWADLTDIVGSLQAYNDIFGYYPELQAGTFIKGLSVSAWPSWGAALGADLGMTMPVDPLNDFAEDCGDVGFQENTCWSSTGFCPDGETVCITSDDCEGTVCQNRGFYCPRGSNVYWYNLRGGNSYNLGANFEYHKNVLYGEEAEVAWSDSMSILTDLDSLCSDNTLQGICGDGFIDVNEECDGDGERFKTTRQINGVWRQVYERYTCSNSCEIESVEEFVVGGCGDGIVQNGEFCDDGEQNGIYGYCAEDCRSLSDYCGDGTKQPAYEICDKGGETVYGLNIFDSCRWDCRDYGPYCGDGAIQYGEGEECEPGQSERFIDGCNTEGGYQQYKIRTCGNDCRWRITQDECTTFGRCGNGIVESEAGEECDDGFNDNDNNGNGIPDGDEDRCNNECKLTVCGDGIVQKPNGLNERTESCDLGDQNGEPCTAGYGSTASSCTYCSNNCENVRVSARFCGDGIVDTNVSSETICEIDNPELCLFDQNYLNNLPNLPDKDVFEDGESDLGSACLEDSDCGPSNVYTCEQEEPGTIGYCALYNPAAAFQCGRPETGQNNNGKVVFSLLTSNDELCPPWDTNSECGADTVPNSGEGLFTPSGTGDYCITKYFGMSKSEYSINYIEDLTKEQSVGCTGICRGGIKADSDCLLDKQCPNSEICDTDEVITEGCNVGDIILPSLLSKIETPIGQRDRFCANDCQSFDYTDCECNNTCSPGEYRCSARGGYYYSNNCYTVNGCYVWEKTREGELCGSGADSCNPTTGRCVPNGEFLSICDSTADCDSGLVCSNGRCRREIGSSCDADSECASNECENNVCVGLCVRETCSSLGYECGTVSDGCGGTISCGGCPTNEECVSGRCIAGCVPDCSGKECGSDGCGGTCGTCPSGEICNTDTGVCADECQPDTSCGPNECGTVSDGCGGTISCGGCPSGEICNDQNICESEPGCRTDADCSTAQMCTIARCIDGVCETEQAPQYSDANCPDNKTCDNEGNCVCNAGEGGAVCEPGDFSKISGLACSETITYGFSLPPWPPPSFELEGGRSCNAANCDWNENTCVYKYCRMTGAAYKYDLAEPCSEDSNCGSGSTCEPIPHGNNCYYPNEDWIATYPHGTRCYTNEDCQAADVGSGYCVTIP